MVALITDELPCMNLYMCRFSYVFTFGIGLPINIYFCSWWHVAYNKVAFSHHWWTGGGEVGQLLKDTVWHRARADWREEVMGKSKLEMTGRLMESERLDLCG